MAIPGEGVNELAARGSMELEAQSELGPECLDVDLIIRGSHPTGLDCQLNPMNLSTEQAESSSGPSSEQQPTCVDGLVSTEPKQVQRH